MLKDYIVKILSAVFFAVSLFFIREIFLVSDYDNLNNSLTIKYGILILSVFSLFLLNFLKQKKVIVKDKTEKQKHIETKKEEIKETFSETEQKVKNIISYLSEEKNPENISETILKAFAKEFYIVQGLIYLKEENIFKISSSYALYGNKKKYEFKEGQGLPGQAAISKKIKILKNIPEDYIQVVSGLGAGVPKNIVFIPFVKNGETVALAEIALFDDFPHDFEKYYPKLNKETANKIK